MKRIARKSDGRRIFTSEYKKEHIGRVIRGDLTLAKLSRELGIARGLLQRWKRLEVRVPETASALPAGGMLARDVRTTDQQIGELQRLVGRQTVELYNLRAELDAFKSRRRSV